MVISQKTEAQNAFISFPDVPSLFNVSNAPDGRENASNFFDK